MKPGRNEPCPCGSGKKYKHCCLVAGADSEAAPADLVWRRLRNLLDNFSATLLRFASEAYGPQAVREAWHEFMGDDVEFGADPLQMQLFMPWFFYCWTPDPVDTQVRETALHDVPPAAAYLAAKGRQIDPLLRRYIESLLNASFSFFEVLECDPGRGMTLRDVMTREDYEVTERSASKGMQRGDLLFGLLATVDKLHMLDASNGFAISPLEKAPVVALRARLAAADTVITCETLRDYDFELFDLFHEIAERAFNPQLPALQNTDGEPLSPHKLVFDLKVPPQAAFDALTHLALDESPQEQLAQAIRDTAGELTHVRLSWKKRGNQAHADWQNTVLGTLDINGKRLTAEVNSQARAVMLRKEIETALGAGVRYRATEIQSLEKMLADARAGGGIPSSAASEEHDRLAELPEVREKVAEMMAAHWERWVAVPIPMLGGRTPMDAVRDADGREIVESLVVEGERLGQRMNPPTDPLVFVRVRERLGLVKT